MHLNKIFILLFVSAFLVSCSTGFEVTDTYEPQVRKVPQFKVHKVPHGSYIIAINDQVGQAIMGNRESPQLVFLDLRTGELRSEEVPIVPRLALKLGEDLGLAIFGHGVQGVPSSKFLILRGGSISEFELAEPIRALHGLFWPEKRQLIIGDQESDTLVFIDIGPLLKAVKTSNLYYSKKMKIPIGRLVLEDEPYDFELVSKDHLALSYVKHGYFEIIDLNRFLFTDRVRQRGFTDGLLLASPTAKLDPYFFMILNGSGASMDLFKLSNQKADFSRAEFKGSIFIGLEIEPYSQKGWFDGQAAVFEMPGDAQTVWAGYGNRLAVYKLDQRGSSARSSPWPVIKKILPLQIKRIDFFDNYRQVAISSPNEGILLVSEVKKLLDWR